MNGVIVIYGAPNDPDNERARGAVRKLDGVLVTQVLCPASVRDLYRLPFIKDESGERYFGVEEIERFVDRRLAAELAV